jgi:predicted nucleotidyltransferase
VPRLVAEFHPARIILFGSAARGEAGEDSDIDLCLVAPTELPYFERLRAVQRLYRGKRELQAFVYTPEEWQKMLAEGRGFIRAMLDEGRLLYEA